MALAGRLRPNLALIQRILRTEHVFTQRSATQRSSASPNFATTESLRNYATATSSKEGKVKVPLALFGVSGNYASALFLSASKANLLDKVESELLDLVEASKKSSVFSQFINDLSVPGETRVKAMQEIFSEAGFLDITKNFWAYVNLSTDWMVNKHYENIKSLPPEEEKQLKDTLQDIIGHGKTVKLEQKIDQSIFGGLVVEFGQKLFDMSIRTRARWMEKFLRDPVNF